MRPNFHFLRTSTLAACLAGAILLPACNGTTTKRSTETENQFLSEAVNAPVGDWLQSYFELKNALVASDAAAATREAKDFSQKWGQINTGELSDTQRKGYDTFGQELSQAATVIAQSNDLTRQREAFSTLANAVYNFTKLAKPNQLPLYRQYCPMAFGNKGGYWVSESQEIKNPYFGDAMLGCGSVQETY